jgi:hypothetical protein
LSVPRRWSRKIMENSRVATFGIDPLYHQLLSKTVMI